MDQQLVELVRQRRRQLGWTQSDLARAMGSSPARICKLEANDHTVAASLALRALDVMEARVQFAIDPSRDPLMQPGLLEEQRREVSVRMLRRKHAERIAERYSVDAGDVEHVLFNLSLPPWRRLKRSFERAGLRRLSPR